MKNKGQETCETCRHKNHPSEDPGAGHTWYSCGNPDSDSYDQDVDQSWSCPHHKLA